MNKQLSDFLALVVAAALGVAGWFHKEVADFVHWPTPNAPVAVSTPVRDALDRYRHDFATVNRTAAAHVDSGDITSWQDVQKYLANGKQQAREKNLEQFTKEFTNAIGQQFDASGKPLPLAWDANKAKAAFNQMADEWER